METFDTTNVQIKDMTFSKSWYLVDHLGLYDYVLHQFVFKEPVDEGTAWQLIESELNLDGQLYPVYGHWLVFHEDTHKSFRWSRLYIWSKRDVLKYKRSVKYSKLPKKTY